MDGFLDRFIRFSLDLHDFVQRISSHTGTRGSLYPWATSMGLVILRVLVVGDIRSTNRKRRHHMSDDIYARLREFMDRPPAGFPKTPTGVEIRLLEKMFTLDRPN